MTDPSPTEPGQSDSPGLAWLVVLALPVVYILSVGPAQALYDRFPALQEVLRVLYRPVEWLVYHAPFGPLIVQYTEWWR